MPLRIPLTLAIAVAALVPHIPANATAVPAEIGYDRDIQPILSNDCLKCHGRDTKNNPSGLRLDLQEQSEAPHRDKEGRVTTPIVPGRPDLSEVWRRINATDRTEVMPPPDALKHISTEEKTLIKLWIEQGAKYQPHWAYRPPKKPAPPAVRQGDAMRNDIDRFIVAAQEKRGVKPSPEADRRTLIRRISLDLTGLPPTPAETEAFVADTDPAAYDHLVDRLLASPHYGERMAVPWLDLARFADTVGYHGDQQENDFPYREYVIDAFNSDKPFDRFTIEQLAGDLLPDATDEDRVASGLNRLNMMTREGGAQSKEYLAKYAAERVRTVATTWMGSTMQCCECHDHKFDPFETRDFYSMEAYFADLKQYGVYTDYKYTPEPELKGFNNDSPFPPEIEVVSPYLVAREKRLRRALADRCQAAAQIIVGSRSEAAALEKWVSETASRLAAEPGGWAVAPALESKATGGVATKPREDGSVFLSVGAGAQAALDGADDNDVTLAKMAYRVTATLGPVAGPVGSVRVEVLPDPDHGGRVTSGASDNFVVTKVALSLERAGGEKPVPIPVAAAYPDRETDNYTNGYLTPSVENGWRSKASFVRDPQSASYLLAQPVELAVGDHLVAEVTMVRAGRIRFAVSPIGCRQPLDPLPEDTREAFKASDPTPEQQLLQAEEYFRGTGLPAARGYAEALSDLREISACNGGRAFTVVSLSVAPRVTRVLPRGDWQNESGAIVQPSPPSFLLSAEKPSGVRQTRLDLARWLVSRANPLTARTFVNRLWAQFFGTGLSVTVDDLGTRGDYPSNPELLDWLAVEFMDRRWEVKSMVRLIVTSAAYRQSSKGRPDLDEADPQNRLFARQNPRRLDAEFIRDNALSAAGLLNLDIGGPSAHPYQPAGYYAAIQFPSRDYVADTDERQYRRGLYMHWQRTFLHPMLANFDAPSREECTAARTLSSTPQQALTLLNDPTFVEAARGLAEETLSDHTEASFGARLDGAFERLLDRPARPAERASLDSFFRSQLDYYRAHPADAVSFTSIGLHPIPAGIDRTELAAWTSVTRVMLNLNETIVRY